jgi:hypothetical protein
MRTRYAQVQNWHPLSCRAPAAHYGIAFQPSTNHNTYPVVTAFLAFIEKDLKDHSGRTIRLSKTSIARALRLTKGVQVGDNERLPEDVTF